MRWIGRLLGAWTAATLLFLYLPIVVLVVHSFNASRSGVAWKGFTLDWYRAAAGDRALLESLATSLEVALLSTALSLLLGGSAAWLLHRYGFAGARLWRTLAFVPMLVPEVVLGVGLLVLFAGAGLELGYATVVVSHVTLCFPFVLVTVEARLATLDPALEEAAMDLGATPALALRRVVLPLLAPAVYSGALLAFSISLDEVIVTSFVAGADSRTLPLEVLGRVRKGLDPGINAVSTVFVVVSAALVVVTTALGRGQAAMRRGASS